MTLFSRVSQESPRSHLFIRGFLAAVVALAMLGLAPAAAMAQSFKLGIVTFLSGPAAGPFGIPARDAAELIIEAINAGELPAPYQSVGIAGSLIEPVVIDEAGGTTTQVAEFRKLVQRQKVEAVVGYISSGNCLAIAPVAEEAKMLTVFFDCGTPRIFEENDYRYVFRTAAHGALDNIGAARYLAAQYPETETYAGLNQNYAWGQDSWRDFHGAMRSLRPGSEAVTEQFPKIFAGQYASEITALLLGQPEAVHVSLWGGDLESFVFQAAARQLHTRTRLILTTAESAMFRLGERIPDGVVIAGRGPYGVFGRETPLNVWFRERYEARFETPPVYPAYHMAQAILGLKVAYDRAAESQPGLPSLEAVIAVFENMEYEAFGTTINMALGNGHQAITETALGQYKYDQQTGKPTVTDVRRFPAECVNPPAGVGTVAWIEAGMPGAVCE